MKTQYSDIGRVRYHCLTTAAVTIGCKRQEVQVGGPRQFVEVDDILHLVEVGVDPRVIEDVEAGVIEAMNTHGPGN